MLWFIGPQIPALLPLPAPPYPLRALFVLALVIISSPSTTNLCLQKQLASFPVMVIECLLGSHVQPGWQVPPLNKGLGGFTSTAPPPWPPPPRSDGEGCWLTPLLPKADILLLLLIHSYCSLLPHHLNHIFLKSFHSAPTPRNHKLGNLGFSSSSFILFCLLHSTQ